MATPLSRRRFIKTIVGGAAVFASYSAGLAWSSPADAKRIPIAMFHKVDEKPRYPEDITSKDLTDLFDYAWYKGFYPVNMSDILLGRVDETVPKGKKPLGITADDSHRSIIFTRKNNSDPDQRNNRSFYEILKSSADSAGVSPRATLFISEESNNRYKGAKGYFGETASLPYVVKKTSQTPGVEFGFHTRWHKSMKNMGYAETFAVLNEQLEQFEDMGVMDYFVKIIAYPFGIRPKLSGIQALKDLGFYGGVLAYGGNREAGEGRTPFCPYDKKPLIDPFFIPRVNIGEKLYDEGLNLTSFDPIDDFNKDIGDRNDLYVSKG